MIEDQLKELMKERYGSVKNFARKIDMPYSTLDTILKRGLLNSNVQNVITICQKLEVDLDEIRNDKIVYRKITQEEYEQEIYNLLSKHKHITFSYSALLFLIKKLLDKVVDLDQKQKNQIASYLELFKK